METQVPGPRERPRILSICFIWNKMVQMLTAGGFAGNLNGFFAGIQLKRQLQKCGFA
jgi:hypothetical protein